VPDHTEGAPAPLLEIGRIGKPHALAGQVLVRLTTNVEDRLTPGTVVTTEGRAPRQLTVVAARPHQQRWIVTFEGVDTREAAEALTGVAILAEPLGRDVEPDALWVHELIGSEVVDTDGTVHGTVRAVLDNPASDILELEDGRLVPLTFVVGDEPGRLVVDAPPGILTDVE
jgi:16S rRNA processing protein RimM